MKRRWRRVLLVFALAATTSLLGIALLGAGSASAAKTVRLGDNFFKPKKLTVSRRTKVRFNWTGNNRHNVTKTKGPGKNFASKTTRKKGVNFSRKFKKSGTYRMICTIHPTQMKLRVKVG